MRDDLRMSISSQQAVGDYLRDMVRGEHKKGEKKTRPNSELQLKLSEMRSNDFGEKISSG